MMNTAMTKVSRSDAGNDQRIPSSPMNTGIIIGRDTPNTTSRSSEMSVDSTGFPSA